MSKIGMTATRSLISSEDIELEPFRELKPGTEKLRINYFLIDPQGVPESVGFVDVFGSGEMECFSIVPASSNIIYDGYVEICEDNPQPMGRLANGLYLIDGRQDKKRMTRAETLLKREKVTIKSADEMRQQVEASYEINIPSFHI